MSKHSPAEGKPMLVKASGPLTLMPAINPILKQTGRKPSLNLPRRHGLRVLMPIISIVRSAN